MSQSPRLPPLNAFLSPCSLFQSRELLFSSKSSSQTETHPLSFSRFLWRLQLPLGSRIPLVFLSLPCPSPSNNSCCVCIMCRTHPLPSSRFPLSLSLVHSNLLSPLLIPLLSLRFDLLLNKGRGFIFNCQGYCDFITITSTATINILIIVVWNTNHTSCRLRD